MSNVIRVPGANVTGVIYFVKSDNPPCVDCDAPAIVLAVFHHGLRNEIRNPVCAVDGVYSAADGAIILRLEDEDIVTRAQYPEPARSTVPEDYMTDGPWQVQRTTAALGEPGRSWD